MPVARRPKGGGGASRQDLEREAAKDLQRAGGSPGARGASPGGWTPPAPGQPIMGEETGPDEEPPGDDHDALDPEQEGEAVTELALSWLAEQERPGRRQPAGDFAVRVDPASATAMRDRALREHMERHERLRKELPTAPWNQKRLTVGKPFSTPTKPLRGAAAARPAERPAKKKAAKKAGKAAPASPPPDELPLEDYDSLSTAQIVSLLDDLDDDELEAVAAYEEAHRNRSGILGAIDDIFAEQPEPAPRPDAELPIQDYDDLTVEEIVSLLDDLDDDELEAVAAYEEAHRNRAEILDAIDGQFEEEPAPPPAAKAAKKAPVKKAAKKAPAKKAPAKKAAKKAPAKKAAKKAPAKKAPAKKAKKARAKKAAPAK